MFSVDQHDWLVLWQQSNPNTLSCASLGSCSKQLTHFFRRAISLLWMWDLLAFWDRRCHPVSAVHGNAGPRSVPVCWQRSVPLCQHQEQGRDIKSDGEVRICVCGFVSVSLGVVCCRSCGALFGVFHLFVWDLFCFFWKSSWSILVPHWETGSSSQDAVNDY